MVVGRTLTVLVADVVESTRLNSGLGPERSDEVRRTIFSRFDDAVAAHGGTLVKTMGDGCLVTYPSASDGVASGVEMIEMVHRLARQVPGLQLRVGVAVGDITAEDTDVFGEPVVIANRLCASATPDQVLTTDLVRELAGGRGGFEWERVGSLFLKGIATPVAASAARAPQAHDDARPRLPRALRERPAEMFVGRAAAIETLTRAWKDANAGDRRAVVISGEPGVGKTRLVAHAARRADDEGALVLFARCEEDLAVPYQPFTDALRLALETAPRDLIRAHIVVHGGELRRLFPRMDAPDPIPGAAETEQLRLLAALTDILHRLSDEQPVVLVVEDIHWAAPTTVHALRHLIGADEPSSLLVVATFRDTEVDRHHPLAGLLAELPKIEGAQRISLEGLDRGEIEELVEVASGEELTDASRGIADALFDRTAGNAFFASQILRHMAEAGALVYRDGQWQTTAAFTELPDGVVDVVTRRLGRLADETNEMLEVGAVCGESFSHALVARSTRVDDVATAIDEAVSARLLTEDGRGGYGFAHAIVREVLIERQTLVGRAQIHHNIAAALRTLHGDGANAPLHDLAYHACGAVVLGDARDAARYALLAADACVHRADVRTAIAVLHRAWKAIDTVEPLDHVARFDVCDRLAELHYQVFDGEGEAVEAAAVSARVLESAERLVRLSLHAYRWDLGIDDQFAMGLVDDALAMLPPGPSVTRALALASGAYLLNMQAHGDPTQWTADAFAMIDELGGPHNSRELRMAWEYAVQSTCGQPHVRDVIDRIEDVDGSPYAHSNDFLYSGYLGTVHELYMRAGNRPAAQSILHKIDAVAGTSGDPTMEGWAICSRVMWALLEARYEDAPELMQAAVNRVGVHVPNIASTVAAGSMWMAYERGRSADVIDTLKMMAVAIPDFYGMRGGYAVQLCELGRFDEAREELASLMALLPSIGRNATFGCVVALLAEAAAQTGAVEFAPALIDELEPFRGEVMGLPANLMQGAADRFRGPLLALLGKREEGIEALRAALVLENELGATAMVVRTKRWLDRLQSSPE